MSETETRVEEQGNNMLSEIKVRQEEVWTALSSGKEYKRAIAHAVIKAQHRDIKHLLSLLQQPAASERCVECGHVDLSGGVGDGRCRALVWNKDGSRTRCSCACVFATTGPTGEQGTFTHLGQHYDLAALISFVTGRASVILKVSDLRKIPQNIVADGQPCASCKHGPPGWHEQRIAEANLLIPLLVYEDMTILDGLHRIEKAARRNQRLVPCVQITDTDLRHCVATTSRDAGAGRQDDGWVTFGRVKVDIENETETFERIHPPQPRSATDDAGVREAVPKAVGSWFNEYPEVNKRVRGHQIDELVEHIVAVLPSTTVAVEAAVTELVDELFQHGDSLIPTVKGDAVYASYSPNYVMQKATAIISRHCTPTPAANKEVCDIEEAAREIVEDAQNLISGSDNEGKRSIITTIISKHLPGTRRSESQSSYYCSNCGAPTGWHYKEVRAENDQLRAELAKARAIRHAPERPCGAEVNEVELITEYPERVNCPGCIRAKAIGECRDLIEAKQAEWEKLGDYGVNQGYVRRIEGSNEVLAALDSLTRQQAEGS